MNDATSIAHHPHEVIELFSRAINAGDLDAALCLYEDDASFAPQPGRVVTGLPAIREALAAFVALSPTITGSIQKVIEAGDTALVTNDWALSGRQPDGRLLTLSGRSADVVHRRPDGSWRIRIDDPWGAG